MNSRAYGAKLQTKPTIGPDHFAPVVYFVRGGETGPIKIGQTDNIDMRLRAMQAGSPVKLNLLGFIIDVRKKKRETKLHERFAATRLHGEWFEPTAELLAYIKRYAEPHDLPDRVTKAPREHEFGYVPTPTALKKAAAKLKREEALAALKACQESLAAGRGFTPMPKGWIRYVPKQMAA